MGHAVRRKRLRARSALRARAARVIVAAPLLCCTLIGCNEKEPAPSNADATTPYANSASDPSQHAAARPPFFTDITTSTGVMTTHTSGARGRLWLPEIMGPGVALVDVDNDGDLDLYSVNGNDTLPTPSDRSTITNQLFLNDGTGQFTDHTAASGAGDSGYGMGVVVGDVNNDGWVDLYIANVGPDQLYTNNGDGTFTNVTEAAGIDVPGWSCSGAMLDFDRDGDLDIYITQYVEFDAERSCVDATGQPDYCGPLSYRAVHDRLLANDGTGHFTDVSEVAGIASVEAAGLGVVIDDFNDDGWIDLYVANDAYANQLWINNRNGTFSDPAMRAGVALNLHGQAEAGMGVISSDLDRDGRPDIFVTHLNSESNTLYSMIDASLNFNDRTGPAGLASTSMPYTGFGVNAFDVELDGDLDLFVANGRVVRGTPHRGCTLQSPWDRFAEPNLFYRNDGTGAFTDESDAEAELCGALFITRGSSVGDIDGDGDIDVVTNNAEGPARIFRNNVSDAGNWLVVRAFDPELQRDAIGAVVRVTTADGSIWRHVVSPAVGYVSASDTRMHIGLGDAAQYDAITVQWPDGLFETFPGGSCNTIVTVERGSGQSKP